MTDVIRVPSFENMLHQRDHLPFGSDALIDMPWFYAEPIAPAAEPDDYDAGNELYNSFQDGWGNVVADHPATAYTLTIGGKPKVRICATGGEGVPGSTVMTLPAEFWPLVKQRITGTAGVDGSSFATFDVDVDGVVTFVSIIATGLANDAIRFDTLNVGDWLSIETTGTNPDTGNALDVTTSGAAEWLIGDYWDITAQGDITIDSQANGTAGVDIQNGQVYIGTTAAGRGVILAPADANVAVNIDDSRSFSVSGTGGTGRLVIPGDGSLVRITLGAGGEFKIRDSSLNDIIECDGANVLLRLNGGTIVFSDGTNQLLRMDADGTPHIKTGKVWLSDL